MKKLLAIASAVILSSAAAFANVEWNLNLTGIPVNSMHLDQSKAATETSIPFSMGTSGNIDIFFGHGTGIMEIGLNLSNYTNFNTEVRHNNTTYEAFGFSDEMQIGPSFRFCFDKVNAIYIGPGIAYGFAIMGTGDTSRSGDFIMGWGPHINIGYRGYFINSGAFHFGFDCGADYTHMFGFCIASTDIWGSSLISEVVNSYNGGKLRIYAGLTMNFGDRNVDRRNELAESDYTDSGNEDSQDSEVSDQLSISEKTRQQAQAAKQQLESEEE